MKKKDWRPEDVVVKIFTTRTKCACRLTARDVPRGLSPEDVALECEEDARCPKRRGKRGRRKMTLTRKLEKMAAWGKRSRVACIHRLKPGVVPPIINPDDVTLACHDDRYCPMRRKKRKTSSRKR